jgi:hypothetical protein
MLEIKILFHIAIFVKFVSYYCEILFNCFAAIDFVDHVFILKNSKFFGYLLSKSYQNNSLYYSPAIKCIICNAETLSDKVNCFCLYSLIYVSYLKIILDRGCQQDMTTLQILCSFCDWNGLLKNYQVT